MVRTFFIAFACLVSIAGVTEAEAPRFRFQKGETLSYHVVQTTRIIDTALEEKTEKPLVVEATTKIDLVRKWKVIDVDEKGIATIEMSIASMRLERKCGKDEDVFDSAKPDELNKNEMAKHVGPVLAVLRIDPRGQVVEVKESKVGPATRFAADLPFKLVLSETAPKVGESWDRSYMIQLDPPLGTGEKYATVQKYTCQEPKSGLIAIGLKTEIKEMPITAADQIPLLPNTPEGTLYFHAESSRYYGARLKIVKELKNHQGEGSSYSYASTYVEDLMPDK
jgi:hypothetical protein